MSSTTYQYAKAATSLATLESILIELSNTFTVVQQRTTVDDAMIDALVASANALSSAATQLKTIVYNPPQ